MNRKTRDPLASAAALGCWALWAATVVFIGRAYWPSLLLDAQLGDVEMLSISLGSAAFFLSLPTLVAACAFGVLRGSAAWAGVTAFLLAIQLLLTLTFSILTWSPEEPGVYGFAYALVTAVLLVLVGAAFIRLAPAR